MSEIAEFLRARYAIARKSEENKRRLRNDIDFEWEHRYEMDNEYVLLGGHRRVDADEFWRQSGEPAPDPAVIADLDMKLALVDLLESAESWNGYRTGSTALHILAQPFVGHPDHKGEEWAP
ncbi:DUF6221 family protein [Streptomyces sp. BA2]|uniref:DUF6221 family protein n=1 Tax=Streptomyces sp. BA2 TaxID=436595 RepID=UPI0013224957|nr:DUF6221 family protein [Streptomyces sp. BA2]MWA08767.1 hypothetical protein [Streptomyces sp. BA2]